MRVVEIVFTMYYKENCLIEFFGFNLKLKYGLYTYQIISFLEYDSRAATCFNFRAAPNLANQPF